MFLYTRLSPLTISQRHQLNLQCNYEKWAWKSYFCCSCIISCLNEMSANICMMISFLVCLNVWIRFYFMHWVVWNIMQLLGSTSIPSSLKLSDIFKNSGHCTVQQDNLLYVHNSCSVCGSTILPNELASSRLYIDMFYRYIPVSVCDVSGAPVSLGASGSRLCLGEQ